MRHDIWDEPEEKDQPTVGGFLFVVLVMVLSILLIGTMMASCGINWAALD